MVKRVRLSLLGAIHDDLRYMGHDTTFDSVFAAIIV